MPQVYDGKSQGFQLWVNLPQKNKMTIPAYRGFLKNEILQIQENNIGIKIIAGNYNNALGPVKDTSTPVFYFDVSLSPNEKWEYNTLKNFNIFIYIFEGDIIVGNNKINNNFIALFEKGEQIIIEGGEKGARFIIAGGEPIGESVAWYGPIVMNTQKEIQEALYDYEKGIFIKDRPTQEEVK